MSVDSEGRRRNGIPCFTHFEHAAPVDFALGHLDDKNMQLTFPGMAPLTSHADFAGWQSRSDSTLYHHTVRQTWTVAAGDRLRIETLEVSRGRLAVAHPRMRQERAGR